MYLNTRGSSTFYLLQVQHVFCFYTKLFFKEIHEVSLRIKLNCCIFVHADTQGASVVKRERTVK